MPPWPRFGRSTLRLDPFSIACGRRVGPAVPDTPAPGPPLPAPSTLASPPPRALFSHQPTDTPSAVLSHLHSVPPAPHPSSIVPKSHHSWHISSRSFLTALCNLE